jgi:hypothetical protein
VNQGTGLSVRLRLQLVRVLLVEVGLRQQLQMLAAADSFSGAGALQQARETLLRSNDKVEQRLRGHKGACA